MTVDSGRLTKKQAAERFEAALRGAFKTPPIKQSKKEPANRPAGRKRPNKRGKDK